MSLAVYMMTSTIAVFVIGAVFALAWSIAAGQWKNLAAGSRIVLDEDEE